MARGKRQHNKDRERVRQQLEQMNKKYKSSTVTRLRENFTRKITESEMEKDFIDLFEKHHNVCKGAFKGPLKYLVAKLHGCYPGANSLPVSQNVFARFFRRRPVADSSRCLTFLLRCNKHKKHFLLTFFLLMFFFTVTTSEWCLYFLNLAVLLENFIHVRTY